jgi:hypothetical protein
MRFTHLARARLPLLQAIKILDVLQFVYLYGENA